MLEMYLCKMNDIYNQSTSESFKMVYHYIIYCREEQFDDVVLKEVQEDVIGGEEREG